MESTVIRQDPAGEFITLPIHPSWLRGKTSTPSVSCLGTLSFWGGVLSPSAEAFSGPNPHSAIVLAPLAPRTSTPSVFNAMVYPLKISYERTSVYDKHLNERNSGTEIHFRGNQLPIPCPLDAFGVSARRLRHLEPLHHPNPRRHQWLLDPPLCVWPIQCLRSHSARKCLPKTTHRDYSLHVIQLKP